LAVVLVEVVEEKGKTRPCASVCFFDPPEDKKKGKETENWLGPLRFGFSLPIAMKH